MALQSTVRERILTGAVIAVPALIVLLIGGVCLITLTVIVYAMAAFEFFRSVFPDNPLPRWIGILGAALPCVGFFLEGFWGFATGLLVTAMIFGTAIVATHRCKQPNFQSVFPFVIGLFLPITLGSSMVIAAALNGTDLWVLWFVLGVATSDTAAYFGGRRLQGPKLAPELSPNKTISGAVCGLIGCFLVLITAGIAFQLPVSRTALILASLAISFAAPMGDLMGSLVKRLYDIKDFGSLLPGHGGVLDRVVAHLFAAPILLCLLQLGGANISIIR